MKQGGAKGVEWFIDLGVRYDRKTSRWMSYRLYGRGPRPEVRLVRSERQEDAALGRRWLLREYEAAPAPNPRSPMKMPKPALAAWTTRTLVQALGVEVDDRPSILLTVSRLDREQANVKAVEREEKA